MWAGSLVNAFIMTSNMDPEAHMKRLTAAFEGSLTKW